MKMVRWVSYNWLLICQKYHLLSHFLMMIQSNSLTHLHEGFAKLFYHHMILNNTEHHSHPYHIHKQILFIPMYPWMLVASSHIIECYIFLMMLGRDLEIILWVISLFKHEFSKLLVRVLLAYVLAQTIDATKYGPS